MAVFSATGGDESCFSLFIACGQDSIHLKNCLLSMAGHDDMLRERARIALSGEFH